MTSSRRHKFFAGLPYWALLMLVVVWSIVPIYIVIMSAFKIPRDIFGFPPTLVPLQPTLDNFSRLLNDWPEFMRALLNSGIVSLATVVLTLVICLPAAYAFSRFQVGVLRRSALFIIAVRMFPPLIISVPLFPVLSELDLADSHITLVLLYTTFQVTMITWIMKGFIDGIPREIEEAAVVDGANLWQIFRLILIPLTRPVLVAAAIMTGTYAWNEFQFGFLFTSTNARTAPVIIGEMTGSLTGVQWGNVFAGSVVQFIPALIFLWLIQNHLIRGMTSGSLKGERGMASEPAAILASQTRIMDSQHTGRRYRITVSLPLGYGQPAGGAWPFADVPARWPVVYVVDGNWYAGMVTEIIRPMSWDGSTSDAIVVGIGYPPPDDAAEAWRDAFVRRDADLLPFRDEALEQRHSQSQRRPVQTGDARNFLAFIRDELVPTIERDFAADPTNRVFVGHSYGGIFGAFALFEAPSLFRSLIIGSPSLFMGDRDIFKREAAYASAHADLTASVYLYAGEHEESAGDTTLTDTLRLSAILAERQYAGLTLAQQVFLGHGHFDTIAPGARWGLKRALRK